MTAALRSLSESLARAGDPSAVFAAVATELGNRAAGRETIDEAHLRRALAAAGSRASPHQLSIDLRELGVVDSQGALDPSRTDAVRLALELVGESFGFSRPSDRWRVVATIPERYWRGSGLPGVRQTAGTVLEIIEDARRTVRIAVPYVDDPSVAWLRDPIVRCRDRGVSVLITTSPDHADAFAPVVARWRSPSMTRLRIVEVDSESSPLGSHAKVISADGRRAYLGSANMTAAGYGRQFEIGADVSGDQVGKIEQILSAVDELGVVRYEIGEG